MKVRALFCFAALAALIACVAGAGHQYDKYVLPNGDERLSCTKTTSLPVCDGKHLVPRPARRTRRRAAVDSPISSNNLMFMGTKRAPDGADFDKVMESGRRQQ